MAFCYEHPRSALTVDCVVFGFDGETLKLLLIERGLDPFKGRWALPGGFVRVDEELEIAARRELREETGIHDLYLQQFHAFGAIHRDPRERVVSVAYYALTRLEEHKPEAATDAKQAVWFPMDDLPRLAFDHQKIVQAALDALRNQVRTEPIGFHLLPPKFTLTQLQLLYEAVLGRALDARNFRKKLQGMRFIIPVAKEQLRGRHRPAQLYRFDPKRYERTKQRGFHFEL